MEELDYEDIISGLLSKQYEDYKLLLLQQLTNKLAEGSLETTNPVHYKILKVLLILLSSNPSRNDRGKQEVNIALCALNNATSSEAAVESFFRLLQDDPQNGKILSCLHHCITKYIEYNPQAEADVDLTPEEWEITDEWQHLGSILCNLCQLEEGRKIVLHTSTGYMQRLGHQVKTYCLSNNLFHSFHF
jgi:hypothetical protein